MTEFEKWAPGISVFDYHSATKREKELSLKKVSIQDLQAPECLGLV